MSTIRKCDKCGSDRVIDRRRRFNLDLCEQHSAELELWLRNPRTVVGLPEGDSYPVPTREAPLATSQGRPMPKPQMGVEPSPGGLVAGKAPRTANVQAYAPMRPSGVAAPDDARAPTRSVAPGFPFPGGAPDYVSERAAEERQRAPLPPPTALLDVEPLPPPTALLDAPPPAPPDDVPPDGPPLELAPDALDALLELERKRELVDTV